MYLATYIHTLRPLQLAKSQSEQIGLELVEMVHRIHLEKEE